MVKICPECGGEMYYDKKGFYVCLKCGLTISKFDSNIKDSKDRDLTEEDKMKEYLKWWLSSKKK